MVSAMRTGIVAALLAVSVGVLLGARPPEAYGICMACHGRDLVNWTINAVGHTRLEVAPPSVLFPALTTIGVLLGAIAAATRNGEFRWRTPDSSVKTFAYGMLVMNLALIAGGCSTRLLLRASSGELLGMIAFAGMAGGVVAGTYWLRWRATR
jgi:hypothetical protein